MKLTDEQVAKIRELHAKGLPGVVPAERFGVTPVWISLIVNGHRRPEPAPDRDVTFTGDRPPCAP